MFEHEKKKRVTIESCMLCRTDANVLPPPPPQIKKKKTQASRGLTVRRELKLKELVSKLALVANIVAANYNAVQQQQQQGNTRTRMHTTTI